ncbi:hypothetical protein HPC49_29445 [Pyxidicoccus fallax]|uniref:Lipoprotein n=1 Tax=Pyxidicoccus fallax TaxID=394095 RepID=A0A848LPT9_9BACT|nr:hypothetical protein [Pyxidicoccus fallax]NMO19908.1 hypothetical protein [Pyxidicoccus fallax]NPC82332.1 hypothetical protein [Pyxidicoccus fallax]
MSLAKNVALVVLAASLTACGGAELEPTETPEPVTPPAGEQPVDGTGDDGTVSAAAICRGWENGGDYCLVDCGDGSSAWHVVGHYTSIPYGDCVEAGRSFCLAYGWSRLGSCWGY